MIYLVIIALLSVGLEIKVNDNNNYNNNKLLIFKQELSTIKSLSVFLLYMTTFILKKKRLRLNKTPS